MNIYLTSTYLAPIQYYTKFLTGDHIFVEKFDNYVKQTYRNRCIIISANGPISLSIPVIHSSSQKIQTKDIIVSDHGNWQHMHWNAIVSAYNSTPFFEFYQDYFYPFYHRKIKYLADLNDELQYLILDLLNIDSSNISFTDTYKMDFSPLDLDFREAIHPKKGWETDSNFNPVSYYQVFDQKFGFLANMSILDLLFNMGNESLIVLQNSIKR